MFAGFLCTAAEDTQERKVPGFLFPSMNCTQYVYFLKVKSFNTYN